MSALMLGVLGFVPMTLCLDHASAIALLFPRGLGVDLCVLEEQQKPALFDLEIRGVDRELLLDGVAVGTLASKYGSELVGIRLERVAT